MSINIYYTIRENKKSRFQVDTLFFGKQWVFDYKKLTDEIFDDYESAVFYCNSNNVSYDYYHIRKTISTSGNVINMDYIHKRSNL